MKLTDVKKKPLTEGRVDPNVLMSIGNIIKNGKMTDHFQVAMLARFIEMMKHGEFYKQPNWWEWQNLPTPKQVIDVLRGLPDDVMTDFAKQVYTLLTMKDQDKFYQYVNPTQELLSWIYWVARREATD